MDIIDIITARQDDLAAKPDKYEKFLGGIYRAVDCINPTRPSSSSSPRRITI